MTNPNLQGLMQKEVSRKEFMGVAALAIASIFGFEHIVKLFTGKSLSTHKSLTGSSTGSYGK